MAERKAKIMGAGRKGRRGQNLARRDDSEGVDGRASRQPRAGDRRRPAVGLSTALGVTVTSTLDDIRRAVIKSAEDGRPREAIEMLNESRFRILDTMVRRAVSLFCDRPARERGLLLQRERLPQGSGGHAGRGLRLCGNRRRSRHRADTAPNTRSSVPTSS